MQTGEPFGLVLTEAMACGTPVAALDRGAVREIVEDGITGGIFSSLDQMVDGLTAVVALDRASVRARTVARFGVEKMIDAYEEMYARLATGRAEPTSQIGSSADRCGARAGHRVVGNQRRERAADPFLDDNLRALLLNDLRIHVVLPQIDYAAEILG